MIYLESLHFLRTYLKDRFNYDLPTPHILLVLLKCQPHTHYIHRQFFDNYETLVGKKYKKPVDSTIEDVTDSSTRLKEREDSGDNTNSNSDLVDDVYTNS